jgi:uncharacterized protein (TIGR02284 family)
MYNDKQIEILNTLIEINNDRIERYKVATADVEDLDLKLLFSQFMQTSEKCKTEIEELIVELGGTPIDATHTMAIIHRAWMDFKAMLNNGDRISILNSCAYGEEVIVNVYKEIFINEIENLFVSTQKILKAQHLLLQADHSRVIECIKMLDKLE